MDLDPPAEGLEATTLESLIQKVNEHAAEQGYAVVLARTLKDKAHTKKTKAYIQCVRSGKPRLSKSYGKRKSGASRCCDCPFECIAKVEKDGGWTITQVKNSSHNHEAAPPSTYHETRKLALTPAVEKIIDDSSRTGATPSEILSILRLQEKDEESIYDRRDFYNIKSKQRAKRLGTYTPVQALMQHLHGSEKWFVRYQKSKKTQRLKLLFFCRESSQKILSLYPEVLVMDATYKTNRYRMPLFIITGVTCLNTTFYVGMAFMDSESTKSYKRIMEWVQELYSYLNIPSPEVILSDSEDALIAAAGQVFPTTELLLCVWHINNNVTTNCKRDFLFDDDWNEFSKEWKQIIYANTEEAFDNMWSALQARWEGEYAETIAYIARNLIPKKEKFVHFWTNQCLHFGNYATSRGERANGKIKVALGKVSTGDLLFVFDKIDLTLINESKDYSNTLAKEKVRYPRHLNIQIFRDLKGKVSLHALRRMETQWLLLKHEDTNGVLKPCTGSFTRTMGLPCAHKMKIVRDDGGAGVLKIEYIHRHWRLKKAFRETPDPTPDPNTEGDEFQDIDMLEGDEEVEELDNGQGLLDMDSAFILSSEDESEHEHEQLLQINEPAVIKPKGRPKGAGPKSRRPSTAHDHSTQRLPSGFEYATATPRQQRGRGRGGASRGGATRGGTTRGGAIRGGALRGGATRGRGATLRATATATATAAPAEEVAEMTTVGRPVRRRANIPKRYRHDLLEL